MGGCQWRMRPVPKSVITSEAGRPGLVMKKK
jgi:hypothetical protein